MLLKYVLVSVCVGNFRCTKKALIFKTPICITMTTETRFTPIRNFLFFDITFLLARLTFVHLVDIQLHGHI
jgi:hypothetical protein